MSLVSYAQNYEDIMLWRAFQGVEKGFFIDVGANAPIGDSVTYLFYEHGWRGINIEPIVQWFEMLSEMRPEDINLHAAISDTAGFLTLYDVPDTGLATTDLSIAERHRQAGHDVFERTVPAYTLDAVCAQYAPATIHFLKIDVEGAEAAVLRSINLERYRPQIILVEATLPNSTEVSYAAWEGLITSKRYDFAYFDGLNRFYVAQEASHLKAAFSTPPNVLDGFIHYREVMHRETIARLQAQLAAQQSVAASPEYQPLDTTVLNPLAWADVSTEGGKQVLLQVGSGLHLLYQQQERTQQALWRLAQTQAQQTATEQERLRLQEAAYQRRIFELEQSERQWQQRWQEEQQRYQEEQRQLVQDKERILAELQAVYSGTIWRMTKPLRSVADHAKPLLRKVREGSSAWLRLTPESRPRRLARRFKQAVLPRLGRWLRQGKDALMRHPASARYLQATLERFPAVRYGLRSWAQRATAAQHNVDMANIQTERSPQVSALYRTLQPPRS